MLKFGNTFVNFGGAYLTDWDYYKPPVIENGWSELYNLNPFNNSLSSSNSADSFHIQNLGYNHAYIISAWNNGSPEALSSTKVIQTFGENSANQRSYHIDRAHNDDKNFTYLLYKLQVAPHSVGGAFAYTVLSATNFIQNSMATNSNPIVNFSIGDKFTVGINYASSAGKNSVPMMRERNNRFLCSSYNLTSTLNIDGSTTQTTTSTYDYIVPGTAEGSDYLFSAYVRPQTFNYLIKLNESNIDVSAYLNNFESSADLDYLYSGTYNIYPSYFKESWNDFSISAGRVGNYEVYPAQSYSTGYWGFRSPLIEEVGLSAFYENELNYNDFKNLALRSYTANYVPDNGD